MIHANSLTPRGRRRSVPVSVPNRIGYIGSIPPMDPDVASLLKAFRQALQERGYVEGRNVVFEQRFAEGKVERFPALATELVRLDVDVLVVSSTAAARAAKEATATIPIVVVGLADPVAAGLVASLGRPGGNITGVANNAIDLNSKRLELIKAAVPNAGRILYIGGNFGALDAATNAARRSELAAAAQSLGITLLRVEMNSPQDFEVMAAAVVRERPEALLLARPQSGHFRPAPGDRRVLDQAPTAGDSTAPRGGARRHAHVLRPEPRARLPKCRGLRRKDSQGREFELVINLKTAKALGLTIPKALLLRADEVIQ